MDGGSAIDDTTLLAAARAGDRGAFAALYRRHAAAVHGLALRVLGDRSAAEDVVQDVFLRALDHVALLRDGDRLAGWLKRSAANACIDLIRRRKPQADPETLDRLVDENADPFDAERLPALLDGLAPATRALLWLFVVEGWTHPELAERFGRSESWSKSIISRALRQLRARLPEEPDA
jgi:RNA polymerase sigma-70 factor (ECF subfamily)